ncbi:carboxylating nicotinate-nucleotide diphosphorylase [Novosphingobium sp. PY1]|uniref:carboxylating nicotinate-nucleotide diphosphorylase n=1 Tax=Novosphingobium sp. PY1 TaxID=1882221 RepID=UPI000BE78954|nr:carboxylating nicotinate-nucleotide diphosphorylase [Novosphingobium sp. PY1]BBA74033.1 nicotinate-nucleotide pyrophosphorylase [Novosphingobium sp. PY1]GFM31270.1 nicotinate-nucleotide pyrophosphorylase [Novosphingobium sp. PY1]
MNGQGDLVAGLTADQLDRFVSFALAEDLGEGGDVTSAVTIPEGARLQAVIATRQPVVLAGIPLAEAFFRRTDPDVRIERLADDGSRVEAGAPVLRLEGAGRAMLAAERSALNTLQHLTGIATLTRRYADAIEGTGCTLLDTRKTIPGLRVIEKYASRMGGAQNHRMRLDDGILIKDNHVAVVGGIEGAVRSAKEAATGLCLQVEVDRVDQIEPALSAGAERLLCDNMGPAQLREAVSLVAGRVPIEASGGITLETIRDVALTGVDYVSVGRLTQSAPAADIGLDYALG